MDVVGRVARTCIVLAALAASAHADPPPDRAKAKVAKQYVDAGLAAQSTGDYDTAITFYSKAAELVPHPVLTFNIAQAHRLAGRIDKALALYRAYLQADPHGAQAATARELIAEIERRRAEAARQAEDARRAEAARKLDEARQAEDARRAEAAHKLEAARKLDEPRQASAPSASADPSPGRALRLWGVAAGATGVVALGVGIGFAVHGAHLSDELSRRGARYDPDKVDAGTRANILAATGVASGVVLISVGAVLYWRGHARDQRERVAITPLLSDDVVGVALAGALP